MPDEPEVSAEYAGAKVRAKGYRTLDLAWILVFGTVIFFGLEARANHAEMRTLAESQVRSNTLIACLISQPQVDRQREFVNENGFCNRISGRR